MWYKTLKPSSQASNRQFLQFDALIYFTFIQNISFSTRNSKFWIHNSNNKDKKLIYILRMAVSQEHNQVIWISEHWNNWNS